MKCCLINLTLIFFYFILVAINYSCKKEDETITVIGTIEDIEGNIYKTVKIGGQWWMAENLRVTKFNNGTNISNLTENIDWWNLKSSSYCWYHNDACFKNPYGAIYNGYAAINDAICPTGWHLPGDDEWKVLENYLGMTQSEVDRTKWRGTDQGTQLKNNFGWPPYYCGNNTVGFSALPSGTRVRNGVFEAFGLETWFWSTTPPSDYPERLFVRGLYYEWQAITREDREYNYGLSIRCIKAK